MILYEKYTPQMKDGVLTLLDSHWCWADLERSRSFFEWRYEDNPYTGSPCIFLARDGNRIIGVRCFVVQKFRRASSQFLIACAADAIVHPDFRRKGILHALSLFSIDLLRTANVAVVLSLSSNRASSAAARKLGWKEFGMSKYMYRLSLSGLGAGQPDRFPIRVQTGSFRIDISRTTRPEKLPNCFHPCISDQQILNVRDEAYYSWRYRQPFTDFYFVLAQDADRNGYLILKKIGKQKLSVMEYGCDDVHTLNAMVASCSKYLGAHIFRMLDLALSEMESALFQQAGFFYEPRMLLRVLNKHRAGALAHLIVPDTEYPSYLPPRPDLAKEANWHILGADVH